jgi:hypothetical protein
LPGAGLKAFHLPCERLCELGRTFDVVYCDGIVGHIWRKDIGFDAFAGAVRPLLAPGGLLVVSADMASGPGNVHRHPLLEYYHFSAAYLFDAICRIVGEGAPQRPGAELAAPAQQHFYEYQRPVSGSRTRHVVVVKAMQDEGF